MKKPFYYFEWITYNVWLFPYALVSNNKHKIIRVIGMLVTIPWIMFAIVATIWLILVIAVWMLIDEA